MKAIDTPATPRRLSLKAVAGIVVLAVIFSVAVTLIAARLWLFPGLINPVDMNQREEQILEAKLNTLQKAEMDQNASSSPSLAPEPYLEMPEDRVIYFTQRELNALIARNPDLAHRVSLHLSQGLISATMLVDLPRDFPVLGSQTIRVSTGLHLDYQQGRPVVTIKGVTIMGVPVPGAWLGGLKERDLVAFYGTDAGFWQVFSQGVTDLRVEQGKLRVELAK